MGLFVEKHKETEYDPPILAERIVLLPGRPYAIDANDLHRAGWESSEPFVDFLFHFIDVPFFRRIYRFQSLFSAFKFM